MQTFEARAHLPAVRFAPRAYMGCGGWDLAKAPETTGVALNQDDWIPGRAASRRSITRPRRSVRGFGGGYDSNPIGLVESEGVVETLRPGISGRSMPQVTMGCGEEACEECAAAGMGCTKCKRIRKNAARNQSQEMEGSRKLGQAPGLPDTSVLLVSGLTVAGLFYLALR